MKTGWLVLVLLLIAVSGTGRRPVSSTGSPGPTNQKQATARQIFLRGKLKQVAGVMAAGDWQAASAAAKRGYQNAARAGEWGIAAKFLGNLGGCHFYLHKYREALQEFTEARRLAERANDEAIVGSLDLNISSLYFQLGETDAAIDAATQALERLAGEERKRRLPKLLIHLATLRARQERLGEAEDLFRQGIAAADRTADCETAALGWNDLGQEYLERNRLAEAERPLRESFRIRKLQHLRGIESSYRNLGILRLEQGDLESASALLNRAVAVSREAGGILPSWKIYYARGRVFLARHEYQSAWNDLRAAARLARVWRRSVPMDDGTRISAENSIQEVHAAVVEAGNQIYFATHGRGLAQATFEAVEANRAASLRALRAEPEGWRRRLPAEYWTTLRKLESAEVDLLRASGPGEMEQIQQLHGALVEFESQAGSNTDFEMEGLLARVRKNMPADAAYLSFHLGAEEACLWAISRERFELYRLGDSGEIADSALRFATAVKGGNRDARPAGLRLYRQLFGRLAPVFQRKRHWLLAPDSRLFEVPFAALVAGSPGSPEFLMERHSLQVTAGAGLLAAQGAATRQNRGRFLGVADAIYNTADPRWTGGARPDGRLRIGSWLGLFAASTAQSGDLHLARLPGTGREIAACAGAWGGSVAPVLLQGADASRVTIQTALGSGPAVLHFATHVLQSRQGGQPGPSGLIVLSLKPDGQNEILDATEIATWHLNGTLVALSGCSSAVGDILPATGLMGLTRAWQAAGASAVVANLWPSPDDSGELFLSFYTHLRGAPRAGPAVALQQAQMDMLHTHTWRSSARYWGSYFISGNQP